jgi:hypothetical protein
MNIFVILNNLIYFLVALVCEISAIKGLIR